MGFSRARRCSFCIRVLLLLLADDHLPIGSHMPVADSLTTIRDRHPFKLLNQFEILKGE